MQKKLGEKINLRHFLLLGLLFGIHLSQAQKQTTFYLMPHVGIEWPISQLEDKNNIPPFVKGINMNTSAKYGFDFLIDFNNAWNLSIGYGLGNIGEGIEWEYSDSVINDRGTSNSSTSIRRGYLSVSKPIKLIEIRKKKHAYLNPLLKINKEYAYWAVFEINLMVGVAYEYIPPYLETDGSIFGGFKQLNTLMEINKYGAAGYAGIYFQFYKNRKKTFRLGATYHQGFKKRLTYEKQIFYRNVEQPPTFKVFTRGSMVAIYIAYPIKLFSIKEKGTIKK